MIEVERKVVQKRLELEHAQVICISSPNFESRSLTSFHWLSGVRKQVRHIFIRLNTNFPNRVETLEHVKRFNLERAQAIAGIDSETFQIDYPQTQKGASLDSALCSKLPKSLGKSILLVDISSMPRRLIVGILDWLERTLRNEVGLISVYVIYTWAEKYAISKYPEKSSLRLMIGETALTEDHTSNIRPENFKAILYPSRSGTEGQMFVSHLPDDVLPQIMVFFDPTDPYASFERMRSNIHYLKAHPEKVSHCFSFGFGHDLLCRSLEDFNPTQKFCFLIAPFGPKPCAISSWLLCRAVSAKFKHLHGLIDIVTVRSQSPSSLYSIGHRNISLFELNLKVFRNPKLVLSKHNQ